MNGRSIPSPRLASDRFIFFFSSRRRHTRLQGDWSSDVCSSDLPGTPLFEQQLLSGLALQLEPGQRALAIAIREQMAAGHHVRPGDFVDVYFTLDRSEERRVGKECRSRWSPYH